MKKLTTIMAGVITVVASAQSTNEIAYGAYLTASKTMWEKAVKSAAKQNGATSFEKAMALYGLLNNTMATQDEETFDNYKDQTIELLEEIIESNEEWGEPRAVLSSVYGLVMAYSPMKGMYLGMKSSSLMEEAMKLQPESPIVQKLFAGSKLYTPEIFGGDPEMAVESFQKSLLLFEKSTTQNNWLYLDSMMGLSLSYQKTEKQDEAIAILEKAVDIEPDYYWGKSTLKRLKEKS